MTPNRFLDILAAARPPARETASVPVVVTANGTRTYPFKPSPDPLAAAVEVYRLMRNEGCTHPHAIHGAAALEGVEEQALAAVIRGMWVNGEMFFNPSETNEA